MNPIEYEYREWLVSLAFGLCEGFGDYRELFEYLYSREFVWIIDRDRNRAADGVCLRDTFADIYGGSFGYFYIYHIYNIPPEEAYGDKE